MSTHDLAETRPFTIPRSNVRPVRPSVVVSVPYPVLKEVRSVLWEKGAIKANIALRVATGLGLLECKTVVDTLTMEH